MHRKTHNVERISKSYCEKHDAYYDTLTREWLESACDSPECIFCHNRPPKYQSEGDVILDKIEALHIELKKLQDSCPHEHTFRIHRSEDGYAEPTKYFTDFTCNRCRKQWAQEGTWSGGQ